MAHGYHIDDEAPAGKMKIVCHACDARYLVRGDKVQGRRFRAKCKRCGGTIVARCDSAVAGLPDADTRNGRNGDRREAPADDQWYVVVSGQPQGPFGPQQIREGLKRGRFTERSYAWRQGQPEWRRLQQIEELRLQPAATGETVAGGPRGALQSPRPQVAAAPAGGPVDDDRGWGAADDADWTDEPLDSLYDVPADDPDYFEAEVTRLHRSRGGEMLRPRQSATPDAPEMWHRGADADMGRAPGKLQRGWDSEQSGHHAIGPMGPGLRAGRDGGAWSPPQRRPAALPAPARRGRSLEGASIVPPAERAAPAAAVPHDAAFAQHAAGAPHGFTRPLSERQRLDLNHPPLPQPTFPAPAVRQDSFSAYVPAPPLEAPPVPLVVAPAPVAQPPEPFWTTGRIIVAASIGGGLLIVAMVIVVAVVLGSRATSGESTVAAAAPSAVEQQASPQPEPELRIEVRPPAAAPADQAAGAAGAAGGQRNASAKGNEQPEPKASAPRTTTTRVVVQTRSRPVASRRRRSSARASRSRPTPDPDDLIAAASRRYKAKADPDAILAAATGSPRPARAARSAAADPDAILAAAGGAPSRRPAATLTPQRIKAAMAPMRSRVQACFDRFRQPGQLRLRITVQSSGRATGSPVGEFAGTPTGACAANGIRSLQFGAFSGSPVTFTYPFALR